MKKILLSASLLMLSTAAFAVTDGQTYAAANGFTCENLWIFDRFHTGTDYEASPICSNQSRTAATDGEYVYVTVNATNTGSQDDPVYGQVHVHVYDLMTGAYVRDMPLTLDGNAYEGQLAANTIGFDSYGHLYVAPYNANGDGSGNLTIYIVDKETGALTSAGDLYFFGQAGRVDYIDVVGDLTAVEARCDVMATSSEAKFADTDDAGEQASASGVYWWYLQKGTPNAWNGGFNGGMPGLVIKGGQYYPETITTTDATTGETVTSVNRNMGNAATLTMVRSLWSETDGPRYFYAEGNAVAATLYDMNGAKVDDFGSVQEGVIIPAAGTNGIHEMMVGDQAFIVYSEGQYDAPHSCQAIISTTDADYTFASINNLWTVPADGMGQTTDGGNRIHCITSVALPDDANGKAATLVLSFKSFNGMAVYRVAEEGYGSVAENVVAAADIRVNGDVIAVSEVAESIEVYNVAGQKVAQVENTAEVAAPATGLYIVKAVVDGTPVVKKVIVK